MRVLHITTYLQGGAGRAITDLAIAQHRRGDDVVLATSAVGEPGFENYPEYLDRLHASGVRLLLVDSTFKRELPRFMSAFAAIRRDLGSPPDVIHAHAALPSLIGLLLAGAAVRKDGTSGIRVVQTMHGWARDRHPDHVLTDVGAMNGVTCVAVPSQAARAQLIEAGVAAGQLRVIAYGIPDMHADQDGPDDDLAAAATRWRAAGRTVLICIGSIGARKNQSALLDALAAPDLRSRVGVILIGEGEIGRLREQALRLDLADSVLLAGYRREAARHLALADWLVLPSTREGLPLAVIESLRAGLPALVTDLPELRELVEPHATGLTAASGSADDLAQVIREALTQRAAALAAMAAEARARWQRTYRLDTMVSRYDALYADAAN